MLSSYVSLVAHFGSNRKHFLRHALHEELYIKNVSKEEKLVDNFF